MVYLLFISSLCLRKNLFKLKENIGLKKLFCLFMLFPTNSNSFNHGKCLSFFFFLFSPPFWDYSIILNIVYRNTIRYNHINTKTLNLILLY